MALPPGARLGPYEIVAAIGAGGMGEVYRARDSRLDRTVAIKILPAALASDPHFLEPSIAKPAPFRRWSILTSARCTTSASTTATRTSSCSFLEGETLADRIAGARTLALPEALQIGVQIADALDAAHRRGIVHRDLKPGNAPRPAMMSGWWTSRPDAKPDRSSPPHSTSGTGSSRPTGVGSPTSPTSPGATRCTSGISRHPREAARLVGGRRAAPMGA